jgi:hypothetical protein
MATNRDRSLNIISKKTKSMSASLQNIPQYVEGPPNIEAKHIILYFFATLFY